ncbi:unnamed protein product, partial [Sphacelaria rigidula]
CCCRTPDIPTVQLKPLARQSCLDRMLWYTDFWPTDCSLLWRLSHFSTPRQGKSPTHVFDTLHYPTERSLAHFSDSLGSKVLRAATELKPVCHKIYDDLHRLLGKLAGVGKK